MTETKTAGDALDELLRRAADDPTAGLRFVDRREDDDFRPWASFDAAATRVAGGLQARGVGPGDRVALVYPTEPDFFHAFFGIVRAGAVPVPLYPPVRLGRLAEYHRRTAAMLRAAGARAVLAGGRVRRLLGETVDAARPALGCLDLADLPEASFRAVPRGADDLALVQFSSGTTVDPKPVALSHRAILAQVRSLNGFWPRERVEPELGGRPTGVSWLPLYHDMGLIGCVFPALEYPSVLTLLRPEVFVARPAVWLRAISRYDATISVAPNFAYGLAVEKIADDELEGVDLSPWRIALNGAEPVAPRVLRAFQERFARWGFRPQALTPVYGLSEAALAVTFSSLPEPFATLSVDRDALARDGEARVVESAHGDDESEPQELPSLGRPLPGFELEIRDDAGQVLPERSVGRLWVRGPSLMDGYLDRPEATDEVLVEGWLDTGDTGFLHGGELYLTGRAKDLVLVRGRNYAPAELETALDGVEGVRRGCVVAVSRAPDGAPSEEVLLFVEHAADASDEALAGLEVEVTNAVLATTGLRPDVVHVLEPGTLPRTSSGKLRRGETLRRHLAGELLPPSRVTPFYLGAAFARSALAYRRAGRRTGGGTAPTP